MYSGWKETEERFTGIWVEKEQYIIFSAQKEKKFS